MEMYDEREGELYSETRDMTVKDIASLIRQQLRDARKNGAVASQLGYSVRYTHGAGYRAIDVWLQVPTGLRELGFEYEKQNDVPLVYASDELLDGEFVGLRAVRDAYDYAKNLHAVYNFYSAPVYGDGCSVRYFGGVSMVGKDK
jgi:hypothetical protein